MGVFTYSDVDTAQSYALGAKVPEQVKSDRRDALMALQRKISARNLKARVGKTELALLEGPSKESELLWEARLAGMAPEIDGKVYINDISAADAAVGADRAETATALPEAGDLVRVAITEAHDYDLVATVLETVRSGKRRITTGSEVPAYSTIAGGAAQRVPTGAPLRILQ
jgi:ribosomal protein S12 methylthiotransferase